MTLLQQLRPASSRGHVLALAAICLLIVTLAGAGTARLGLLVTEKLKLQDATDAAAWSIAAEEARVLNFLAYTNRAMVAHYAGQMTLVALATYLSFSELTAASLSTLPYLGPSVFVPLKNALGATVQAYEAAVAAAIPMLDMLNYGLHLVQEAAVAGLIARLTTDFGSFVRATGHPDAHVTPALAALLGPAAGLAFGQTVITAAARPGAEEDRFHRLQMVEAANAARHPWTAHGGDNGSGLPALPRRAHVGGELGPFQYHLGKQGRTEWGTFRGQRPGASGRLLSADTQRTEQLYSVDELRLELTIFGYGLRFSAGTELRADRTGRHKAHQARATLDLCPQTPDGDACRAALEPVITPLTEGLSRALDHFASTNGGAIKHFGQAPYARFRAGRKAWQRPSAQELFNQPTVLVLATVSPEQLSARGALVSRRFAAGAASLDLSSVPESAILPAGLNAAAAAMACYHRPGDWREPPNLFSPFWEPRLIPINDSPALAALRLPASLSQPRWITH